MMSPPATAVNDVEYIQQPQQAPGAAYNHSQLECFKSSQLEPSYLLLGCLSSSDYAVNFHQTKGSLVLPSLLTTPLYTYLDILTRRALTAT
jgi:hypothetical protein